MRGTKKGKVYKLISHHRHQEMRLMDNREDNRNNAIIQNRIKRNILSII